MTAEQIKKLAAAGLTVEQIAVVAEVMETPRQATPEEVMYHVHGNPIKFDPPPYYPPGARGTAGGLGQGLFAKSPDINDLGFRSEQQTER